MDNTGFHPLPLSKRMSFEWRGLWFQTGVRSFTLGHCPPPRLDLQPQGGGHLKTALAVVQVARLEAEHSFSWRTESDSPISALSVLQIVSLSGICSGPTCPFAKTQAHRSYCFQNNFLALNLKLNCPLRVSYFVCFCLSCGYTTLALSPLVGEPKVGGVSVLPPSLLQGAGPTCPTEAEAHVLLRARYNLPQTAPQGG